MNQPKRLLPLTVEIVDAKETPEQSQSNSLTLSLTGDTLLGECGNDRIGGDAVGGRDEGGDSEDAAAISNGRIRLRRVPVTAHSKIIIESTATTTRAIRIGK